MYHKREWLSLSLVTNESKPDSRAVPELNSKPDFRHCYEALLELDRFVGQ
jgi:hypothetical protein